MHQLYELQQLEFTDPIAPAAAPRIAALRAGIPAPILAHYDRLRATKKKGLAVLRNQTCTGCHMRVPLGVVVEMQRDNDIHLCEFCQRYLYLPAETAVILPKIRRRRAPREALHAV